MTFSLYCFSFFPLLFVSLLRISTIRRERRVARSGCLMYGLSALYHSLFLATAPAPTSESVADVSTKVRALGLD